MDISTKLLSDRLKKMKTKEEKKTNNIQVNGDSDRKKISGFIKVLEHKCKDCGAPAKNRYKVYRSKENGFPETKETIIYYCDKCDYDNDEN
jgi:DNA-directed RNA polymerase subunit M/transcription elongation factor TFIIS